MTLDEAYTNFEHKVSNKFMKIAAVVVLILVLIGGCSTCALRKLKKLMKNVEQGKYQPKQEEITLWQKKLKQYFKPWFNKKV